MNPENAASNVKIVTSSAALSLLGPEYRWRTTLHFAEGNNMLLGHLGCLEYFVATLDPLGHCLAPGEARARVAPLFDALGQRTIWVGEAGAGTRLKLVNNTWLAFAAEAVAASVALARRLGLETETVVDAFGGSPLMSTWQAAKLRRIADGEFSAQFALSLALKDVHLALQAAGDDRFAALACLADEWQQAVDQGLGQQDLTIVTRVLEQQSGTP